MIPFSPPDITEAEIDAVCEVLRSGWITTGSKVDQFEKEIAAYCGTERASCFSSQTSAAEMTLRLLGVGEGDEVIVPAYTYTATASVVLHVGAKPVMWDLGPNSFEPDYSALERLATANTKCISPVDLGGVPCDYKKIYDAIGNFAFTPNSKMQEAIGRVAVTADTAHSLGASRGSEKAGSMADFSCFSFHAVKNVTTAEGGAAAWKAIKGMPSDEVYKEYSLLKLHGQTKSALEKQHSNSWEYDILGAYYKCNMTDIAAAIGCEQLRRYESLLSRRHEIAAIYSKALDESIESMPHVWDGCKSSAHLYITRVRNASLAQRNEIIARMYERGISCNVHYKPLPMLTAYRNLGYSINECPNAYSLYSQEISLPLHTLLSDEQAIYIAGSLNSIVRELGL
ncbi:MAG: DegT/DnrJ/EryC1/StrS aminotransferase family protein [Eubacteriaceae bacterium]|nr:DegT/DnrJ/EryC1/StrS aminotransferase family protein [Eubacteriaceae bacterium]